MKAAEITWPMQTHLELAALPSAVPCVRGHVRAIAHEWGLGDLSDTAELLASELVTNAVQAAADPIRVQVTCDGASITIYVWDSSPRMPVLRDAPDDAEGGRGLMLVSILGSDWGISEEETGKTVWVWISR